MLITKDQITGALDGSFTIDNRLFTEEGRADIANDFKNLPDNLGKIGSEAGKFAKDTVINPFGTGKQIAEKLGSDYKRIGENMADITKKATNLPKDIKDTTIAAIDKVKEFFENPSEEKLNDTKIQVQVYIATLSAKANDPNATPEERMQAKEGLMYIDIANATLSEEGFKVLKALEGTVIDPNTGLHVGYLCDANKETIGYGYVMNREEQMLYKTGITDEAADNLLKWAVNNSYGKFINENIKRDVTQNQFDAFVLFIYNVGYEEGKSKFPESNTLNIINNPNSTDQQIVNAMKTWNKVKNKETGKLEKNKGLDIRLKRIENIYMNGEYGNTKIKDSYQEKLEENKLLFMPNNK